MNKIIFTVLLMIFVPVSVNAQSWRNDHYSDNDRNYQGNNERKVCSAIVPGVFRDSIVVHNGWGLHTCSQYAKSIGGTHFQLGCITSDGLNWSELVNRKDRYTRVQDLNKIRSCGWRNGRRDSRAVNNASRGIKICSAVLPGIFRDTIRVKARWSVSSCQNFAKSVGASNFQVGCMQNEGFNWGKLTVTTAQRRQRRKSLQGTNCGWRR